MIFFLARFLFLYRSNVWLEKATALPHISIILCSSSSERKRHINNAVFCWTKKININTNVFRMTDLQLEFFSWLDTCWCWLLLLLL
jgi:hypothetical protein